MKKLITLALCTGVIITGIYTYHTNVHNTKITSLELKNDPIATLLKEKIETNKQIKLLEIKTKKIMTANTNIIKNKSKKVSRGEELQLTPIKVIATAYAPYDNKSGICNDGSPDSTATGTKPHWGCIASDFKEFPAGTKLLIPEYLGNEICTVEDTGGALRRDKKHIRIDLYMDTYEQAMKWGVKEITVYIIK